MRSLFPFRSKSQSKENSALVLAYHRVAELRSDPWALAVSPAHFAEHLAVLRRTCNPITLDECVRGAAECNLPERAVAITFDDGYGDNFYAALPILRQFSIPATVFITNGAIGGETEFWWDELERLLLIPGDFPLWRAWEDPPTDRHRLYRDLHPVLQASSARARADLLDSLRPGRLSEAPRPTHRTLTAAEFHLLARDPHIQIGSHTLSHPMLSSLPIDSQQDEIQGSKGHLERLIDQEVRFFAYPYGRSEHYSCESVDVVALSGFAGACSFRPGKVNHNSQPFDLARCGISDWDGGEFSKQITKWFRG